MIEDIEIDESVRTSMARIREDPDERVKDLFSRISTDETLEKQQTVFSALGHEDRLRILSILREGECCVCELQAALDAPQSTVASHLRLLRDAGLVNARKNGKWTFYRIADTATFQLLDLAAALGGETD